MFRRSFYKHSAPAIVLIAVYGVAQSFPVPQAAAERATAAEATPVLNSVVESECAAGPEALNPPDFDVEHDDAVSLLDLSDDLPGQHGYESQ